VDDAGLDPAHDRHRLGQPAATEHVADDLVAAVGRAVDVDVVVAAEARVDRHAEKAALAAVVDLDAGDGLASQLQVLVQPPHGAGPLGDERAAAGQEGQLPGDVQALDDRAGGQAALRGLAAAGGRRLLLGDGRRDGGRIAVVVIAATGAQGQRGGSGQRGE
jgi:hypothetical protein